MDLLIISNYWHFECEKSSSRYLTIANMAADADIDVEVITSTFYHAIKAQRKITEAELARYKYKTTLVKEPGYDKNVDLKRIISHKKFAKNVIEYLKKRKKPDVIYLFVPPLDLAKAVMKYANINHIRIIIDVLDLWPEAYNMILPCPKFTKYFLYPMLRKANYVYRNADEIIAVSDTYVKRALNESKKCKQGLSVYIGTDSDVFEKYAISKKKTKNVVELVYIGMLGVSYNIDCVIDAIASLDEKIKARVKLVVMGDGPKRADFQNHAKRVGINNEFTGKLPYEKMVGRLCQCDIALNPIRSTSVSSIINKVADYAAAGIPVINTQKSEEYRSLLCFYNAGYSVEETDINGISSIIKQLVLNEELRVNMGKNGRKMFEERFDRKNSYPKIINKILDN